MRLFGVKLLTTRQRTWLNRAAWMADGIRRTKTPFRVEGKEFLLTLDVQSVMNIFTASG
jgi:hypothetical protein